MLLVVLAWSSTRADSSCITPGSNDDAMLLSRMAVPEEDITGVLAAERAAWDDPTLLEHSLVNRTRRITGSRVTQSVSWLHRHGAAAGGSIERVQAAALAAVEAGGWELDSLGALHVRCVESIRYDEITLDDPLSELGEHEPHGTDAEGWHQDEWSVLTAVLVLSTSADLRGGDIEVDRGSGPRRTESMLAGDLVVFRSWDAHRSTPLLQGRRHILVLELWQGPPTTAPSTEGRPAELPASTIARLGGSGSSARDAVCGPALEADGSSAALLWFCAKSAGKHASGLLLRAAEAVASNGYLFELAAAALALTVLDELGAGTETPSLAALVGALRRASRLRTAALVPDPSARAPIGWDEDEDGAWEAGLIDGGDGGGGFFRQMSAAEPCGFPAEGLRVLRRMMALRGSGAAAELRDAVAGHPVLWNAWLMMSAADLRGP